MGTNLEHHMRHRTLEHGPHRRTRRPNTRQFRRIVHPQDANRRPFVSEIASDGFDDRLLHGRPLLCTSSALSTRTIAGRRGRPPHSISVVKSGSKPVVAWWAAKPSCVNRRTPAPRAAPSVAACVLSAASRDRCVQRSRARPKTAPKRPLTSAHRPSGYVLPNLLPASPAPQRGPDSRQPTRS